MTHPVSNDDLMRYLDGELDAGEHERVTSHLASCTECAREVRVHETLRQELQTMPTQATAGGSVWPAVRRRLFRPIGWIFIVAGVAVWAAYATYAFFTSPESLLVKLPIAAIAIGFAMLLIDVASEQYAAHRVDPYREIQR